MSGTRARTRNRREVGQGLILAVLAMAVMMGFSAMAVDVGMFLQERRSLQNAADAAALAGAGELPDDAAAANARAREWAANNGIAAEELTSVQVSTTSYPNDTITVRVEREIGFIFGRVLGLVSDTMGADATARIGSPGGLGGLSPFAVEDEVFQGLDPGDTVTLKYNATTVANGNFLPLALDGSGANKYEQNVKLGSEAWLCAQGQARNGCPSTATTQPGNMVGPTRQGIQWAINNTSAACSTFEQVFTPDPGNPGQYFLTPECNRFVDDSVASYRVIVVPIIEGLCNGSCTVNIVKFALFFVEGLTCGGGGGQGGGGGGGGGGQGNSCDVPGRYVEASLDMGAFIGPYDPDGSVSFVRLVE